MGRGPFGTAQYFSSTTVLTATPLTIACWAQTNKTGLVQHLAGFFNSGSVSSRNVFRLLVQSTNVIAASVGDAAAGAQAVSSTTISSGVPFHACGVWASDSSRSAYLDGGGKGTNTTAITPSGIDRMGVGVGYGSSLTQPLAPATSSGDGFIAELGVWNAALDDAEVASLATGLSPLLVRPSALVRYFPLLGLYSPEIDVRGGAGLTMTGTVPAYVHPRVIYPNGRAVF